MTARQKNYQDILTACRAQTTGWLARCDAEPRSDQNMLTRLARLAVRNALRERAGSSMHDISHITEYGITQRLQAAVRVF